MVKKIEVLSVVFCLSFVLSACGNQNMVKELAESSSKVETNKVEADSEVAASGDMVDLTVLNSTMVYSEVYDMTSKPEDYIGKRVKMTGLFTAYQDETTKKRYFSCIIQDATACCAQGLEFELKEKRKYPEEYPEEEAEITVVGTFDTYEEEGYTYCVIKDAELV